MQCIKCKVELPEESKFCYLCGKKQVPEPRKALKRANGSGTAYKLAGRRKRPWIAAKGKVIIGYYETKTDALEALNKLTGKDVSDRYNMTLAEVYETWKSEHFRDLTAKGEEMYISAYKHLGTIKDKQMRKVKAEDYQKIVDEMEERGLSASSRQKIKQLAGQISKWAIREEIITVNYAQHIKIGGSKTKEKKIFTDIDIKTLKDNSSDDTVKLILIMIYTGLRVGELLSVKKSDVFLDRGYFVGGSKTEAGTNRVIPISETVEPYVRCFYDTSPEGGLLIDGYEGNKTVNNFRRREFYPTLKRLGIEDKTPHSTRHTFASLAVRAGIKPELLQKIIGHADYSTTANIYVHADVDDLKSAIKKLSGY